MGGPGFVLLGVNRRNQRIPAVALQVFVESEPQDCALI